MRYECVVSIASLLVGVKRSVGEALVVILPEELAVTQADMVDLVA